MDDQSKFGIDSVKSCNIYLEQYKECLRPMNKFYHFYTYGNLKNNNGECIYWKDNYDDCIMWFATGNSNVRKRFLERKRKMFENQNKKQTDVWTYRTNPPEMWHLPGSLRYDKQAET